MKVLAAIDIIEGDVVRLTKGDKSTKKVYSNDPVKVAKKWEEEGADMLHIVDLDAAFGNESNNLSTISEILHSVNIPIQILSLAFASTATIFQMMESTCQWRSKLRRWWLPRVRSTTSILAA